MEVLTFEGWVVDVISHTIFVTIMLYWGVTSNTLKHQTPLTKYQTKNAGTGEYTVQLQTTHRLMENIVALAQYGQSQSTNHKSSQ